MVINIKQAPFLKLVHTGVTHLARGWVNSVFVTCLNHIMCNMCNTCNTSLIAHLLHDTSLPSFPNCHHACGFSSFACSVEIAFCALDPSVNRGLIACCVLNEANGYAHLISNLYFTF